MNSDDFPPIELEDSTWFVVWSEARAEKKVAERLRAKGCAVWLPLVSERRRWSDRWKVVTRPLFPGYLFAATGEGYVALLRTPGILTLVKDGLKPVSLNSGYIRDLRRVTENPSLAVESLPPSETFTPGDEVLVRDGPLAGFRGTVVELRGTKRLVVWIDSVGRGLVCTLGDASVVKVGGPSSVDGRVK